MKAAEIRELTADELNTKLADLKAELFNLRFQLAINQLDNPHAHFGCEERHCPCEDCHPGERAPRRQRLREGRINK